MKAKAPQQTPQKAREKSSNRGAEGSESIFSSTARDARYKDYKKGTRPWVAPPVVQLTDAVFPEEFE